MEPLARIPSEVADDNVPGKQKNTPKPDTAQGSVNGHAQEPSEHQSEGQSTSNGQGTPPKNANDRKSLPRGAAGAEPFDASEREEMENLLGELCGHLGKLVDCDFSLQHY